jgi:hypothetical protein
MNVSRARVLLTLLDGGSVRHSTNKGIAAARTFNRCKRETPRD